MKKLSLIALFLSIVLLVSSINPYCVYAADDKKADTEASEDETEEEVDTRPDYIIRVNRVLNCVTIYRIDEGHGQVPIKAFACSTGKPWHPTALGEFETSDYYDWRLMCGDCYSQYAVRFNGKMLLHSVPYDYPTHNSLWWQQYNMLGECASSGCVRLSVIDAKWIYDNCKPGTKVIVYDNPDNPGPLGKPEPVRIDPERTDARGWDPTDPAPDNPWREGNLGTMEDNEKLK